MATAQHLAQIGIPSRHADFLGDTGINNLTAIGLNQATALQLEHSVNTFLTVTAADNGCKLEPIATCKWSCIVVRNDDPADALNVYPATGEFINALAANAPIAIAAGAARIFFKNTAAKWVST